MSPEAIENHEKIESVKTRLDCGEISYSEALKELEPIKNKINLKAKELAKKYNTKPKLVNVQSMLR